MRFIIVAPVYLLLLVGWVLAGAFLYYAITVPNPMALRQKERGPIVRVLARDGSVLAERGGSQGYAPIDLLPAHVVNAVVATEDRRFFEHWGLDPIGLARAALANLRAGRYTQGGSTLSQQLAKNLLSRSERTLTRKLEELLLALWLELRLGKRDILDLYLNRVYFGGGAYGIEAAAQRFFGKPAYQLTLTEAAVLAGLLKAPSKFSPASNPALARARARSVLAKMEEAGFLSEEERETAARMPIAFAAAAHQRDPHGADYAVDYALESAAAFLSPADHEVIVETTIDADLQRRAHAIVQHLLSNEGRELAANQAALVLLDLEGGLRVLIGGRSYAESQFNRAVKAKRQPGSAFKLFVYLAALESGLTPDSIVYDLPIFGAGWSPRNDSGHYRGPVTLREGLAHSINTVAARLHMQIGPRRTLAAARRLGISSRLNDGPSLALGTSEVTLLELTSAYGALANGGRTLEPHIVRRVRSASGRVLYERKPEAGTQAVASRHVAALNDMLNAALVWGTGRRAALALHPSAGKTGTSQDFRDAWFVGYTAHLVAGVWVGNDDARPMNRVSGGHLPAKIWHDVMTLAHKGLAPTALPGTVPANAASEAASGAARSEVAVQPMMPKTRIDPAFIMRSLDEEVQRAGRAGENSWLRAAVDRVRRAFDAERRDGALP
jgi:penicillin-binding protein 1A